MSNDNQITPFDGYGGDAAELTGGMLARPTGMAAPSSAAPAAPQMGLMKRVHNALRGRYWIAIILGLVLGATGGYFGYKSQVPVYRAEATIRFIQNKTTANIPFSSATSILPNFEELLQSEALVMISRGIISDAIRSPSWKKTGLPDDPGNGVLLSKLAKDLSAEHPSRSEIIRAFYQDREPVVAANVIKAITEAYEQYKRSSRSGEEIKKLDVLDRRRQTLKRDTEALDRKIMDAAAVYGTANLDTLYENKLQEVLKLEARLTDAELLLEKVRQKKDPKKDVADLTSEQIAMMDQVMRGLIIERDNIEAAIARLKAGGVLPQHRQMLEYTAMLSAQQNKVAKYTAEWKDLQYRIEKDPNLLPPGMPRMLPVSVDVVEAEVKSLKTKHGQLQEQMVAIGRKSLEIQDLIRQKDGIQKELGDISRVYDAAVIDFQMGDRLVVMNYGEVPLAPFKDRRKMMGMAGLAGGFTLPLVLLAFLGLLDRRYRYSDEANDGVANVPLLGILPRLPDRLSDPEQAAVAAHCIHQIRIMLQVGGDPEKRRVFMITSASTGDGKTSLSIALGLSFAASGSKTLLVDCDMVGQGLTHRMRSDNMPGLIETLNLGTLRGHVRKTATKGLYLLPIGNADSAHAGVLSPQSINRLLAACREHFDIIVIDTGPILGSLEASVVAAESDGVIMAVARGQKQPLVEKAIKHLRSIGAHIFGIVFNRAEHRDFQRSVASASIRSLSARPNEPRALLPESEEMSRFGPLANSVVSCLPQHEQRLLPSGSNNGNGHSTGNGEV